MGIGGEEGVYMKVAVLFTAEQASLSLNLKCRFGHLRGYRMLW